MRTNSRKFVLVLTALTLAFLISLGVGSASPGDLYVDDDDLTCGGNSPCYSTIAAAVAAASTGDTIHVAAGTYSENGIDVSGKYLSIVGEGSDVTQLYVGAGTGFKISGAGCANISGFEIYGDGRSVSGSRVLFYEKGAGGTGTDDKCTFQDNIVHNVYYACYTNDRSPRPQYWAFLNNEFYELRIPFLLEQTWYADIIGNTVKDAKECVEMNTDDWPAEFITIQDNEFAEGKDYCPDCRAAIILTSHINTADISGNIISDYPTGVLVSDATMDMANAHINENCFIGNDFGIDSKETDADEIDAEYNYWGCPDGPDDSACDPVAGNVDYNPWESEPIQGVCAPPVIEVAIDIKPGSCPNPLNVKSKGVLPVAILGTSDFDVTQVDPASVSLEGVLPLRWDLEDVATPFEPFTGKEDAYDCNEDGPDGYLDLTLKFNSQEIVAALDDVNDGDVLVLQLTGNLKEEYGGTSIVGEDVVVILKKGKE